MKKFYALLIAAGAFCSVEEIFASAQSVEITPCEFYQGMAIGLSPPDFFNIYHQTGRMPPVLVTTPFFESGFEAEFGFWRARPVDNQLAYTIVDPTPILFGQAPDPLSPFIPSTNSRVIELDPSQRLSYFASARYVFGNTHRDLKLSYFTSTEETKDQISAPTGGVLWLLLSAPPVRFFDPVGGPDGPYQTAFNADAKVNYKFNISSLDLGHHIFSTRVVDLRVFAGLGGANITRDLDVIYRDVRGRLITPFPNPPGRIVVEQESNFKGIGPRIGASGDTRFCSGFGFVSQIAYELLIGTENSKYLDEVFDLGGARLDATTINPNGVDRVVPAIDGKLALKYTYAFSPSFAIGIEGGYQIFHFFNPITTFRYAVDTGPIGYGGATFTKIVHDANLEGPYLAVNFSGFSSCGTTCPPATVVLPSLTGGFELGVGVDYLKGYNDQNDYAIVDAGPIPSVIVDDFPGPIHPSLNSLLKSVQPKYDAGFHAHIGYVFTFTPYDVTLDYLNLNSSNKAQQETSPPGGIWPITSIFANEFDMFAAPALANFVRANVKASERVGNLEIGMNIVADSLNLRVFGGVQAAEVESDLTAIYNITDLFSGPFGGDDFVILNPTETVTQTNKFSGVGPRIGFDVDYNLTNNLALASHFGASILYGTIDSSISDQTPVLAVAGEVGGPILGPTLGTKFNETGHFIPSLDASIGLAFDMCWFATNHMTFEVGYKFNHYFNVLETYRHANGISGTFVREVNDQTFAGPYAELVWYGITFCPPTCNIPPASIVRVPEFLGGIEFGLKLLYFSPHAGNFPYAIADRTPIFPNEAFIPTEAFGVPALVSSNSEYRTISPEFDTGYGLHFGYLIPCTGNDITANYEYFTSDDSDRISALPGGVIWPQLTFVVGPTEGDSLARSFPVIADEATERVTFRYNYTNLEIGRHHRMRCMDLRLATGLGYVNLAQDQHVVYLNGFTQAFSTDELLTPDFVQRTDIFIENTFTAIGPRFAATAKYVSPYIVGFTATAATDLLIGKLRSQYTASTSEGISTTLNPNGKVRLVPKIQLDLALTFDFRIGCYNKLSLEIGYEANHFFNVTNSYQYTSGVIPSHVKDEKDATFDGPYAQLTLTI